MTTKRLSLDAFGVLAYREFRDGTRAAVRRSVWIKEEAVKSAEAVLRQALKELADAKKAEAAAERAFAWNVASAFKISVSELHEYEDVYVVQDDDGDVDLVLLEKA